MRALELQIEQARREAFRSSFTPSWFVLFKTQKAASIAASTRLYAEDNTRFQVHPAPGPEEVNWQHLWMDYKERDCRTVVTWPLMLLIVLFPITLVTSAASRLEYVFCPEVTPGDPTVSITQQLLEQSTCLGHAALVNKPNAAGMASAVVPSAFWIQCAYAIASTPIFSAVSVAFAASWHSCSAVTSAC